LVIFLKTMISILWYFRYHGILEYYEAHSVTP
jgi:hypothetical protein